MAIVPCGHRVLVRQDKVDEHDIVLKKAREAGLELALDRQTRYQFGVDEGIVVKVGATAWKDFGGEPWAKEGDRVIFAKNTGKVVVDPSEKELKEDDRTPYVILNDEDIVAVVRG